MQPIPIAAPAPIRPTAAQIDTEVAEYEQALACFDTAKETLQQHKDRLIRLVQAHGEVPAGAEKSMRLRGQLTELTVTTGDSITLKDSAVHTLEAAMEANGWRDLFARMFSRRTEYDLVKGAENQLRVASLPARLAGKFSLMFVACFDVKTKSPSLKVTRLADQPTKKTRAKKAGA